MKQILEGSHILSQALCFYLARREFQLLQGVFDRPTQIFVYVSRRKTVATWLFYHKSLDSTTGVEAFSSFRAIRLSIDGFRGFQFPIIL